MLFPRLMDQSVELRFESVTQISRARLEQSLTQNTLRFIAVLDATANDLWRLTILDPASNSAMTRSLAGSALDKAALEATVSIIVSANDALTAGETVGHLSVEEVLARHPRATEPATRPESEQPRREATRPTLTPQANAAHTSTQPLAIELGLGVLGEPLTLPGGYGVDWSLAFSQRDARFVTLFGLGLNLGFPTNVTTALGHSEFHRLQLGAVLSASLRLTEHAELGITFEPFGERVQAQHRSTTENVRARDNPATWGFAARAGLSGRVWLLQSVGLEATTGGSFRANAPVYVDSRDQTLFAAATAGWFVQAGALFRFVP